MTCLQHSSPAVHSLLNIFCGFFSEQDRHHCCVCQPCYHHCLPCKGRVGGSQKMLCSVFQRGHCRTTAQVSRETGAGKAWPEPNASPGHMPSFQRKQSSSLPPENSSILVVQDHPTPFPSRNCIWPFSFQSNSFVLINMNKQFQ